MLKVADELERRSLLQREAIRAARVARDNAFAAKSVTDSMRRLSDALDALGEP